jgi:hypothetical protein
LFGVDARRRAALYALVRWWPLVTLSIRIT